MGSLNKVHLIGNLCQDPTVRYTKSGQAVASFNLATNERWTRKDGTKEEKAEFHRIIAWGKLGEICSEFLSKGKQVYIEGRLQTREWDDKDGVKKQTTEIVANNMTMLGQIGSGSASSGSPQSSPPSQGSSSGPDDFEDDDIPF
jgi:single-strand DNA-binding protein